jgi:hypothetical protein
MKILISESQHKRIFKEEKEQKVLRIPSLKLFSGDWDLLQKFLELKGNPPYSIGGDLDLRETQIESLGNLESVGGNVFLEGTPLSTMYTKKQIRKIINVGGKIYLSYENPSDRKPV